MNGESRDSVTVSPSEAAATARRALAPARAPEVLPGTLANPTRARGRNSRIVPREPIFLASQLASICDVDLKTIHNWCDRNDHADEPAQLECFRTPGGHLRFRHSSVLRFLNRWGYPIPDELLLDRPHLLVVEPDHAERARIIAALELVRPGEDDERLPESTTPGAAPRASRASTVPASRPRSGLDGMPDTLGLYANARWYVHVWDDPYAALVAVGERAGAGAPLDFAVVSSVLPGISTRAWIAALRSRPAGVEMRFAVVTPAGFALPASLAEHAGVVGTIGSESLGALRTLLDDHAAQLMAGRGETGATRDGIPGKRRQMIAPREPIFVASQVARIWAVDLKTVHNWVERGDIEAFCTPGRHLRFRRRSLLHFLRRYSTAIPEELTPGRPRLMIVDADEAAARGLAASLGETFETILVTDPIAALSEIGQHCAGANLIDAVVVALPHPGVDDTRWIEALSRHPETRYTRVVVVASDDTVRPEWSALGAIATVRRDSREQIGFVLEQVLGLDSGMISSPS